MASSIYRTYVCHDEPAAVFVKLGPAVKNYTLALFRATELAAELRAKEVEVRYIDQFGHETIAACITKEVEWNGYDTCEQFKLHQQLDFSLPFAASV